MKNKANKAKHKWRRILKESNLWWRCRRCGLCAIQKTDTWSNWKANRYSPVIHKTDWEYYSKCIIKDVEIYDWKNDKHIISKIIKVSIDDIVTYENITCDEMNIRDILE